MGRSKGPRPTDIAGGRRWTFVGAIAVLGIVVVLGAVAIWPQDTPDDAPSARPAATGTAPPAADTQSPEPGTGPDESACALDASDTDTPKSAPADLQWAAENGNTWPVSASAGPALTDSHVPSCFARTPMGAAMAAVNLLQVPRIMDPATGEATMRNGYLDGPGRDILLEQISPTGELGQVPVEDRAWGRSEGFRVVVWTEDRATITLVENWPQRSQFTGTNVNLHWIDGDWKIALLQDGYTSHPSNFTITPGSYIPWVNS